MKTVGPARLNSQAAAHAALGVASIVAGGLVAAVNSAVPFAHGSWLAAYLVLVAGVVQIVVGLGWIPLSETMPSRARRASRLALWNAGNAAVMAGVLASAPPLVAAGGGALLVALGSFALGVGRGRRDVHPWVLAYHANGLALAVSVGVGCALAGAS